MTLEQAEQGVYRPIRLDEELAPSSGVYWIRLTVRSTDNAGSQWILRLNANWDYVDLYVPTPAGREPVRSGYRIDPSHRPIPAEGIAFPFSSPGQTGTTAYLRLEGVRNSEGERHRVGASFEPVQGYIGELRRFNYLSGVYAGVVLAMVSYNLILFAGLRERTYLFYSLYIFSFGLVWVGRSEVLFQFLWPRAPQWNFDSSFYLVGAAVFFSAVFVRSFLNTRKGPKVADWILLGVLLLTAVILLAGALTQPAERASLLAWLALATSICYWVLGFTMWRRGFKPARFFLLAWTVLIAANIVYILIYLGILHATATVAEDAVPVGSALECILMAFALAERVSTMKSEVQAQQLPYTAELELAVAQRTKELVEVNAQLEAASLTDPLTGLRNRRFIDTMMSRLTNEIKRARHDGEDESLVICIGDVDHFKKMNDDFGHEYGDRALKAVASELAGAIRGTTVLARWGGEEFVLIDSVRQIAEGAAFAERLRRWIAEEVRLAAPTGWVKITMSFGIACYPFSKAFPELLNWQAVLVLADQALYRAKNAGRNCCYMVRSREEKLKAYVRMFGQGAAAQLCQSQVAEALELGLIEVVPIED